jgi:hypothetical protein
MIELIIAVVLSTIVIGGLFQLVFTQNVVYARQQGLADSRQSLRSAGTLLSWELRHLNPAGGDIYAIGPDSISVRSYEANAVICRKQTTNARYGLHSVSGEIEAGDSAMVYIVNSNRTADDTWRAWSLSTIGAPGLLSMLSTCPSWPGAPAVELAVQASFASSADTAGLRIGAVMRVFQRRTYRMVEQDGDWWLAVRDGSGSYQLLTGPLRASDGLEFRYLDAAGAETTVPANVRAVELTLRAEAQLQRAVADLPQEDVVMRVQVRG